MTKLALPTIGKIDTLGILFALLPGLLTYVIVHSLTKRERKIETVEAILHGLAYTLVVHAVWSLFLLGSIFPTPEIVGLSLCAGGVGLAFSKALNSGWIYNLFRKIGITHAASWHSIWETSFRQASAENCKFAVLHMQDERRLMGEVRGYSDEQSSGHVVLGQAEWLTESGPISAKSGFVVVPGEEIKFVQFLLPYQERKNEQRQTTTAAAAAAATTTVTTEGVSRGLESSVGTKTTTAATTATTAEEISEESQLPEEPLSSGDF